MKFFYKVICALVKFNSTTKVTKINDLKRQSKWVILKKKNQDEQDTDPTVSKKGPNAVSYHEFCILGAYCWFKYTTEKNGCFFHKLI